MDDRVGAIEHISRRAAWVDFDLGTLGDRWSRDDSILDLTTCPHIGTSARRSRPGRRHSV